MQHSQAVVPTPVSNLTKWQEAAARAQEYVRASRSDATTRAYQADWNDFTAWCAGRNVPSLPSEASVIALYISDMAETCKVATIGRRLAAISKAHQAAGYDSPATMRHAALSATWRGIRRTHGIAQTQKAPALVEDVRRMVAEVGKIGNTLLAARDRALLLVGFAGAFRRAELVSLDVRDVQDTGDGLVITLRRSKTDQEGAGRKVAIPYGSNPETCPVRSYRRWLEVAGVTEGPVFRSVNRHRQPQAERLGDRSVALAIKRYAEAAGLNPENYAGHSLRSGLVTSAAIAGVSERTIMNQTGHKSSTMVRRYIREANMFRDNAAGRVGL